MVMTSGWPPGIFVCIPSYNAAETLSPLLSDLSQTVPVSQILVVDDGSGDSTGIVCRDHGVESLRLERNSGKGSALAAGFTRLLGRGAQAVITMDADGQHAVADLPRFVECFKNHPDTGICIGKRAFRTGQMPLARIISNTLTSTILSWMCGVPVLDSQCGYRLYSAALLRSISITCPRFEMESEVIIKAAHTGFPIRFVEVQTLYFKAHSHIAHIADTLRWVKAAFGIRRLLKATRAKT
jgi:glycosyltransferase involved in cell wall biosynthesis